MTESHTPSFRDRQTRQGQPRPGRLSFTVQERDGLRQRGYPFRTSVTIPRGGLDDAAHVRLLDHEGTELPVQTQVVSRWPGGSVKTLLMEFTAHLKPHQTRRYTVLYGPNVPPPHERHVRVERRGGAVTVIAGEMSLAARTGSRFWLEDVHLAGRPFTPRGTGIRGFLRCAVAPSELADMKPVVDDVQVAEEGPVQATLLISGRFHHRTADVPVRLQVRAYYTAYLDITHILQPADESWAQRLEDCGIEIPIAAKSGGHIVFGVADGGPISAEASRSPILLQTSEDKFVVLEHGGREVASGSRCTGRVELSGSGLSVAAAVRNAHRFAPIRFGAASYGTAPVLRLALYCAGAPPIKTRHVLLKLETV